MSTFDPQRIQPPHPPPPYQEWAVRPHRGVMILVFGILGFVVLGIVFGPMAWIMGNRDLARMAAGEMDPSGRDLTNAGRICGIIVTVLNLVALLFCLLIVVVMVAVAANG